MRRPRRWRRAGDGTAREQTLARAEGGPAQLVLDLDVDRVRRDLVALDLDALEVAQPLQRGLERLLELLVARASSRDSPGSAQTTPNWLSLAPLVLDLDVELEPDGLVSGLPQARPEPGLRSSASVSLGVGRRAQEGADAEGRFGSFALEAIPGRAGAARCGRRPAVSWAGASDTSRHGGPKRSPHLLRARAARQPAGGRAPERHQQQTAPGRVTAATAARVRVPLRRRAGRGSSRGRRPARRRRSRAPRASATSPRRKSTVTPAALARRRAARSARGTASTAMTSQPSAARYTACAPVPHPRSSARAGGESAGDGDELGHGPLAVPGPDAEPVEHPVPEAHRGGGGGVPASTVPPTERLAHERHVGPQRVGVARGLDHRGRARARGSSPAARPPPSRPCRGWRGGRRRCRRVARVVDVQQVDGADDLQHALDGVGSSSPAAHAWQVSKQKPSLTSLFRSRDRLPQLRERVEAPRDRVVAAGGVLDVDRHVGLEHVQRAHPAPDAVSIPSSAWPPCTITAAASSRGAPSHVCCRILRDP